MLPRHDEALTELQRALEIDPGFFCPSYALTSWDEDARRNIHFEILPAVSQKRRVKQTLSRWYHDLPKQLRPFEEFTEEEVLPPALPKGLFER